MNKILAIIFLVVATSCQSYISLENNQFINDEITQSPFCDSEEEFVYNAIVTIGKTEFSGLLFFNQKNEEARFSFVSKMGKTMVDISLVDGELKIHQILPEFNRNIILNQLQQDFQLFFMSCSIEQNPYLKNMESFDRYRLKKCLDSEYAFFDVDQDGLLCIGSGNRKKPKRMMCFSDWQNDIPSSITIHHVSMINFGFKLTRIPQD